jgi:hypothetical protein
VATQERCLGILHLVKGGGMAVRDAVARLPGSYTGPRYFDLQQFPVVGLLDGASDETLGTIVDEADYREVVGAHRVVMGHVSAATLLAAGCTDLAVQVREPRSRLLSLYRYWQAQSGPHLASWGTWGLEVVGAADLPLAAFLESPMTWPATDGALARQALGGIASPYDGARTWRPSDADRERLAARLSVAEWSTDSDRFVARVWSRLGEPEVPALGRVNVTEVVGGPQVLDGTTVATLERLAGPDRALLDHLMDRGLLRRRSDADLDDEFARTAGRLAFTIG